MAMPERYNVTERIAEMEALLDQETTWEAPHPAKEPTMRPIEILAATCLVLLSSLSVKPANAEVLKWVCHPNLVCDHHVGISGRDEDRADSGGGNPSPGNDPGSADSDRPDRGSSDAGADGTDDSNGPSEGVGGDVDGSNASECRR